MEINWMAIIAATFVPTIVGFVWYNPKVLGTAWMAESGMTEEKAQAANMTKIFVASFILSFLLAFEMQYLTIHQMHLGSILIDEPGFGDPNSEVGQLMASFMEKYGDNFRTFKHGAFHGFLTAILLVLPVLGTNALFEGKSWKYIFINVGYWAVTMAIMGGIVCGWV